MKAELTLCFFSAFFNFSLNDHSTESYTGLASSSLQPPFTAAEEAEIFLILIAFDFGTINRFFGAGLLGLADLKLPPLPGS